MKLKWIALSLAALLCVGTIEAQKKRKKKKVIPKVAVVAKVDTVPKKLYHTLPICKNDFYFPEWELVVIKDFVFPSNMKTPANYRILSINQKDLNEYMASIPYENNGSMKIQLPIFRNGVISCKDYLAMRVVTMDTALQAKYPEIMSFKGSDAANQANTVRIDCNGVGTSIMIREENETLFIEPVEFKNRIYYACYSKNDPNFTKDDFENNRR